MSEANEIQRPERISRTTPVWLVNDLGDATVHDLVGRELAVFKGELLEPDEQAVALLYMCRVTKAVRRYGIDSARHHPGIQGVPASAETQNDSGDSDGVGGI